ncbi:MAG: class I SAM-dependent methyltransferase [Acidimicrobiia bacterium]|nr:class I SAM-dependent methyltransferase [Acidimicrobiia bacterium]
MDRITADLATYYEQEAERATRAGRAVDPQRGRWRRWFVDLLLGEGRGKLIEIGCGPGRDAPAFIDRGIGVAGVDLSVGNARLAAAVGALPVQASLFDLPFRPRSFDAGWTMSTLVHVADTSFHAAMAEICRTLGVGAPLGIGLWGGSDEEGLSDFDTIEPARFFSRRSHDRIQTMLGRHGSIELFETKDYGLSTGWVYQFVLLRVA